MMGEHADDAIHAILDAEGDAAIPTREPAPILCEHGCGRVQHGNASDYYHAKDCRAQQIRARIDATIDPDERVRLQHELGPELAASRYTGD